MSDIGESILDTVKKALGIAAEYTQFDVDITMHINTVFSVLTQLGVGPSEGFSIADNSAVWKDFTQDKKIFEPVKSYISLKVRLMFDPPLNSSVTAVMERMVSELEWRLNMAAESEGKEETENG